MQRSWCNEVNTYLPTSSYVLMSIHHTKITLMYSMWYCGTHNIGSRIPHIVCFNYKQEIPDGNIFLQTPLFALQYPQKQTEIFEEHQNNINNIVDN